MMNQCHKKKQRDQQRGNQRSYATMAEESKASDPATLEEFLAKRGIDSRRAEVSKGMVSRVTANGKTARALLDTGTTGTNLMSNTWAQAHQIPTVKLDSPVVIRMAAKGSRTNANESATIEVQIGAGRKIKTHFLIAAIGGFDLLLGMPFLTEAQTVLDLDEGTAHFKADGTTL